MASDKFFEQYKHPNWQKKRLEALQGAEFVCQRCYCDENQLHVHHKRYVKGRKVWEYDISELEVLCDECHEYVHEEKDLLQRLLAMLPSEALSEITALLAGYCEAVYGPAHADTTEISDAVNQPWDYTVGMIAGKASWNIKNINELQDLLDGLVALGRRAGSRL